MRPVHPHLAAGLAHKHAGVAAQLVHILANLTLNSALLDPHNLAGTLQALHRVAHVGHAARGMMLALYVRALCDRKAHQLLSATHVLRPQFEA